MIVDASALMAILLQEDRWQTYVRALATSSCNRMSAGTWVELGAVTARHPNPELKEALDAILAEHAIQITPVTLTQAHIGHDAYHRYGRGSLTQARLNFGDCFVYALAKETGEPLLFKGDDFIHTDITPVIA